MLCAIWHHMYNLENVKNTHGRVLQNPLPTDNFNKISGYKDEKWLRKKAEI